MTLGRHFHEVLGCEGTMTHRQFRAWNAWLDLQWNQPSRTDYYVMQNTAEIRRVNSKRPNRRVKLASLKIPFEEVQDVRVARAEEVSREMAAKWARARWAKGLKSKHIKHLVVSVEEAERLAALPLEEAARARRARAEGRL